MKNVNVKKRITDIILDILAWLSFFVAVILALSVFFSTLSGTENGKTVFGYQLLIVDGDSMSRSEISQDEKISFKRGDLIIIREVKDYSDIGVGDVITFESQNPESVGETVTHKVRSVLTGKNGKLLGFETYGINTGDSDEVIVDPSAVIGKYVLCIPRVGALFSFFKKPAGFFTSILIPCLLLLIFFSIKVGKQIAKKEMVDGMDAEFKKLDERISRIENEGVALTPPDTANETATSPDSAQTSSTERALVKLRTNDFVAP